MLISKAWLFSYPDQQHLHINVFKAEQVTFLIIIFFPAITLNVSLLDVLIEGWLKASFCGTCALTSLAFASVTRIPLVLYQTNLSY